MKLTERVQKIKPSPTLALTAKAKTLKAQGLDIVGLVAGEPDFDTPENINQAAIAAIKEGFTKYTPVGGIPELKDAIIKKLKRECNLEYKPENILVSCGGKHSLYNAAMCLYEEGDEVIIPAPYWVSYPDQVVLCGAKPVFIDTTAESGFKITPAQLEKAITSKTKVFILNSPSNPTGSAYTKQELQALADVIVKKNIFCISDEIYDRIVYDGFEQVSIASLGKEIAERTLVVNGASKAYSMTGWRMGFAAGPKDLIASMEKIQGQATSNASSIVQKACVEAFGGSQEAIGAMVKEFWKRRDFMVKELNAIPGIKCNNPQGAFYVFPSTKALNGKTTPKGKKIGSSSDFANYLLEDHLLVTVPGEDFGAEGYIRLSYAASMPMLEKAIERMKKAVAELK